MSHPLAVLFCIDPVDGKDVDEAYREESAAVARLGLEQRLLDFELLLDGSVDRALRRIPAIDPVRPLLYRGWMLRPDRYRELYQALLTRGWRLANDPCAYETCHLLPRAVSILGRWTPETTWIDLTSADPGRIGGARLKEAVRPFGDAPIVLKDFVKSQKHYWSEACWIPRASDESAVERVVRRFLELQGEDLVGGLVFRRWIPLEGVGVPGAGGFPRVREVRLFWANGACIAEAPGWEGAQAQPRSADLPRQDLQALAGSVPSRFFSMDVARTVEGHWIVVELGDGQVSGLPDALDRDEFYRRIADCDWAAP